MNSIALTHLLAVTLLFNVSVLRADPAPAIPIDGKLFPPEFILQHKDAIGLNDAQTDAIINAAQKAQPDFEEMQRNIKSATEDLAALLTNNSVKTDAVLAQVDKVLDREREIKRAQIRLVLSLRQQLNAEQIEMLAELKKKERGASGGDLERVIKEKAERVQKGAERWQSEGRDPSPIAALMDKIEPLLREGKPQEVNAILDQALKLIEAGGK